jgi:Protein of unknown function (DUF1648)
MRRCAIQRGSSSVLLLILVAGAAFFVWVTSRSLPEVVASHFGASGVASGFMPRAFYVRFILAFVVGLPLALVFLPSLAFSNPKARFNLPNREYWLAPDRRTETIEFLRQHLARFGLMLVVFLCYAHWLVVRANTVVPPSLSSPWFIGGLGVFLVSALVWAKVFVGRFRNVPR